ncbi:hypothetical protein [Sulfitobacter sp. 1A16808]|uniref:hypothetical protein n=1 Tax=Sulfitobacter sp. 1A16808 TaxID=3368572 RepID=UPI0037452997
MITVSELSSTPSKQGAAPVGEEVDYRDEYLEFVQKIRHHLEHIKPVEPNRTIVKKKPAGICSAEKAESI